MTDYDREQRREAERREAERRERMERETLEPRDEPFGVYDRGERHDEPVAGSGRPATSSTKAARQWSTRASDWNAPASELVSASIGWASAWKIELTHTIAPNVWAAARASG